MPYFKKQKISSSSVSDKYTPKKSNKRKEKSAWTENRLQEEQTKLFDLFDDCGKKCDTCTHRKCDSIIFNMVQYLTPYGESIYKRSFRFRSTLEEMDRVLTDSVNSLLMDIWEKGKRMHSSFGAMLRWKMVYYLDGKINLFDRKEVCSLDQIMDGVDSSSGSEETNPDHANSAIDVIAYMCESVFSSTEYVDQYSNSLKKNTVETLLNLLEASYSFFNKFSCYKTKYSMYIRSLYGINKFLQNKPNSKIFDKRPRTKYYYVRLLDMVFTYLKQYSRIQ